jgi:sugar lactone lactonase YvrE
LQNIGNQTLNANSLGLFINDPYANPAPDFVQVPGSGTPADCTTAFSLGPGAACNLSVDFDPQSSGAIQAVAQFFDNALNNRFLRNRFALSGTGVAVAPPNYTLTVTETGSGPGAVTSGDGLINCSYANGNFTGTCSQSYVSGTVVTLTATPAGTSTFLGWGGACSGTNPTCNVSMNSAMNVTASFSQAFGNVNVCASGQTTPSPCNSTLAVTFNIPTTTTIGVVQVVTQGVTGLDFTLASGNTCTGAIAAGNSCNVNVNFAPHAPGLRLGAVNLFDNGGNLLATSPVYGVGQAPEAAFSPGTQHTVSTGTYALNQAKGLALDAAGDLFVADTLNQRVIKVGANGTQTTAGFGLQYPQGLAVDGAGDLFIADNNLNEVVEVPAGCSNSACQQVVPNPLNLRSQLGVAVDGHGDLFIGDFTDGEVAEVPANGGAPAVVYNPAGSHPVDLGTDAAGDLFIGDFGLKTVAEVPAGCSSSSCWKTIGTGWQEPDSVSVDAAGDVFVADHGLSEVVEVPAGCTSSACQIVMAGGIQTVAATVDTLGDVFISNEGNNQIVEISQALPPSLSFALTNVGSTSADSPQMATIQNIGNQPLAGSLALTLGANFTQNPSSTAAAVSR